MDPRPVPWDAETDSDADAVPLTARNLVLALGLVSLVACLLAPVVYFRGGLGVDAMKISFLIASVTWFAAASYWSFGRR